MGGSNYTISVDDWEVLTPEGFSDFVGISIISDKEIIEIHTETKTLRCTLDHRLKLLDGQFKEAQELSIHDILACGESVIDIICADGLHDVYDLIEVELGNEYFTNGFISHNCNLIYVDECAIIPNAVAEEFFTAIFPTISSGETSKILLTSTPLGFNAFWRFYDGAIKGTNGFIPIDVHYSEIPGRDEKWANEQKLILGELKFTQEVLCHFLGSSLTLIRGDIIAKLMTHAYEYSKDSLDILVPPEKDHSYILVADTSRGVSGDYSAFTVIDVTELPYKMVGKYRNNKISPMLYPSIIHRVATDYNMAMVLVEINDIGGQVADILYTDLEYENVFFVQKGKGGQKLTSNGGPDVQLGIRTDKLVKRVGCSTLKSIIEENKLLIHDPDAIAEFSTFTETKAGFFAADTGYHDDIVITLVLFAWCTTQPFFKDLTNSDLRKSLYESQINNIEQELTPFGIIENGLNKEEKKLEMMSGLIWETIEEIKAQEMEWRSW